MKSDPPSSDAPPVVGWREWVALPALGIAAVKAKVDTGARSSSLHAFDVQIHLRRGREWVRFKVHPIQRRTDPTVEAEAELVEMRTVKTSGGHETHRPVILTELEVGGRRREIELTLVNRDEMGFRMLLGRQAIRGMYLVDPGRSYRSGRGPDGKRRKKKRLKKPA